MNIKQKLTIILLSVIILAIAFYQSVFAETVGGSAVVGNIPKSKNIVSRLGNCNGGLLSGCLHFHIYRIVDEEMGIVCYTRMPTSSGIDCVTFKELGIEKGVK